MTAALHGHDDVSTGSPASDLDVGLVSCVSGQVAARAKASVLRLRGLPFAASDSDVEGFFGGYDIVEVYICRRDGRSTGEAYVVFSTPEDVQKALVTLNKQYMGSRYIELFEAAEADLAAIKKVLEDSRLQGFVVRLRGLPYSATAADIKQFFSGVQLSEDDDAIVFAQSVDGRPTGEAYVELADERALSLAMTRHKELMGNRYIEIFNSSKVDKLQAVQQARFHMQSSQNRRSRWPMFPAAAATAGVHGGHVAGAAIPALPYGVLPSPDQLADTFGATQLNPAPVSSTATQGMQGPAPVVPFVLPVGTQMLQADARGMFHRAAAAAGGRASDATLSPTAAAAIPSVPQLRPLQMMAPQGAMMVGPDGQQLPPVYYMHPAQGMMWAGQPSTARAPMPMGMVPMVPVSGNPLMPNSPSDVAAPTAALGQSAPVWGSDVCQQQPGYQHAAPQAYIQQQIYQPTVGPQQYGSVPMPYVWPGPIPVGALPVSEPRHMPTSMATVGF